MDIRTGRPVTLSPNGIVTSPHTLASSAGLDVLRAGGSAIDAAIATAAALSVIYPHMCSIGGDAFWLIYDTEERDVRYLSGGGKASRNAGLDWFADRGLAEIPFRGIVPATLTVPGAVASWFEAHNIYGRLPMSRNLESAVGYARHGYAVTERLAHWIAGTAPDFENGSEAAKIFLPDGTPPKPGAKLTNPNLARTLEAIGSEGWAGFYDSDITREMVRFAAEQGGFFDLQDFRAQTASWGEALKSRYRDVTIYQTPPPTQGLHVLQMLKLLEPLELHTRPYLSADYVHPMVQAKQIAYHDRDRLLADPDFAHVPTDMLLSDEHAEARRGLIDPRQAIPWDKLPSTGSLAGDTTYVAVVDADGNAASFIQSIYGGFGSAVVAGNTGVVLQNRSAYFSLDAEHPNRLEPGKVPLHTLIASLGIKNGELWSVFGCMGADGQPQIQLQVYSAMIDHGLDIQSAIEAPRWLSGRFALGEARDTLHMEARFPETTIKELIKRGHPVDRWQDWNELAGHAHGIIIDPETGLRHGGADPRSDGAAIGY